MRPFLHKKFYNALALLLVLGGFAVLFTVPVSSASSADSAHAATLESIQRQLNDIFAVLKRISDRIAILLQEAQGKKTVSPEVGAEAVIPTETEIANTIVQTVEPEVISLPIAEPVWKFIEVPSRSFAGGLIILYRYSITAGDKDFTVSSARFRIAVGDVSVKDLEVHAFTDALFFTKAYYNKTSSVGKRKGFLESSRQDIEISLENGIVAGLLIPAGDTRYFELRGFTSGKNTAAYLEVSGEGLPKIIFE